MVATRYKGLITKVILQSGDIASSVVRVWWNNGPPDRIRPQYVANTIPPVGWYQGHRIARVRLDIHGEATEILGSGTPLIVVSGDNVVMTSCAITFTNHLGSSMIMFVVSPVIDDYESEIQMAPDNTTQINMKAYYVTLPALA